MTQEKSRPFLRLIHGRNSDGRPVEGSGHFEPIQGTLIASGRTLVVCTTDSLNEQSFVRLLTEISPRLALDLRATPRFDFGTLNRRRVLALFEALGTSYVDLGLKVYSDDGLIESVRRIPEHQAFVKAVADAASTAVVVFIDARRDYRTIGFRLVEQFRRVTRFDWELILFGPTDEPVVERRLLFISHANPEDNQFVLWLQAQLTRHGYEVWSDLTTLKPGETFWDTIEDVIRKKAVKVLVVASRAAMAKPNVLDEISLAISVERAEQIDDFVIPLRLDLPFVEFRANIARKNAIDYSQSWSRGLVQLVECLKQGRVPRTGGFGQSELENWWARRRAAQSKVKRKPETLISNEFELGCLPDRLYVLHGTPLLSGHDALVMSSITRLPLVPYQGQWLAFLTDKELQQNGVGGLVLETTAATSEILSGNVSFVRHLRSNERHRLLHRLLNRQWEWFLAAKKGLFEYRVSYRAPIMYFPLALIEKDQVQFIDVDNNLRRRKLVGYSEKRKAYWHLGLTGRFQGERDLVMRLGLSVVFTEDGAARTLSVERMRELRRRFCKNWWNDKWRGLQGAAMTWIAGGAPTVVIHDGAAGAMAISAQGRKFTAPVGIEEEITPVVEQLDSDDSDDALEGWEDFENEPDSEISVNSEEA